MGRGNNQSTATGTAFAIPLSVTVGSTVGEPVAGGLVTFSAPPSGASATYTPSGTAAVASGGAAVAAAANATAGLFSVTANSAGATAPASFKLEIIPATINKANATAAVTSVPNSSALGQEATFTATVTAASPDAGLPTGTVTFSIVGGDTMSASLVNGQAAIVVADLSVGSHDVVVTYGGDGNFNQATSAAYPHTVNKENTATTVTSGPNPTDFGQPTTLTAIVTAPGIGLPGGTVTFMRDATALGSANVADTGEAVLVLSTLPAGTNAITAEYGGDASFQGSVSGAYDRRVDKYAAQVTVATTPNPSLVGQSVQLAAAVSADTAATAAGVTTVATGQVTFVDSTGATLGSAPLVNGMATFDKAGWPVGAYQVSARFSGDGVFADGESQPLTHTVNKRSTTTTLAATPSTSVVNSKVTFTAVVAGDVQAADAQAVATPSGQVTFKQQDGTVLGIGALSGGVATFQTARLGIGTHVVIAQYDGDATYMDSTSTAVNQKVAPSLTAVNDAASALEDGGVQLAVLANDLDPAGGGLFVAAVTAPGAGTAVIDAGSQSVTYTPDPGFYGVDSFTYTAQDVNGKTDVALASIVVTAKADADAPPQVVPFDPTAPATEIFAGPNGVATLDLPAGAYGGPLGPKDIFYLVYTTVTAPGGNDKPAPQGLKFGGVQFVIDAYLNNQRLENFTFSAPVTLVLGYDPATVGNVLEATLALYFWNGAVWTTEGITVLDRDLTNHKITVQLSHLSEFAFFAEPASAAVANLYMPIVSRNGKAGGALP